MQSLRALLKQAGPSLLVVLPLAGLAFLADERRSVYLRALTNDANPVSAAVDAARGTDNFFFHGNFRPIGRFWEMLVHAFVFEAGAATGVAPHIVLGVVRIALVVLLALGATAMVRALASSAGVHPQNSLLGLFPMALGAVLVANGRSGALAQFPHTLIGSVLLIVAVTVLISRDRDMQQRSLRWHEYAAVAATGVLAATFYDVAYLTPVIAAVFLAARCMAARTAPREALSLAATKRWLAHAAGFAAVFVPIRVAIAVQCADGGCYDGSDLSLSFDAVTTALPRLLTGFPAVGWDFNADMAADAGVDLAFADLGANALVALLVIGIVALAVTAAWRRPSPDRSDRLQTGASADDLGADPRPATGSGRLACALLLLGGSMAVLSAFVAGLTAWAQWRQPPIGQAWRETLLTQVAWSLVAAACLAALDLAVRHRSAKQVLRAAVAAGLAVAMSLTLLANWRFAEVNRRDPAGVLTSLVALSAVNIDDTTEGNALRCALIEAYTEATADQPAWIAGQAVGENLNDLTLRRLGMPYCDPTHLPPQPTDVDGPE